MQNIQFLVDTHSKFPCVGHGLHFWQGLRRNFDLSTWPNIKHQSLARSHKSQGCVCHTANQTWKVNYNSVDLWCWQIPALVGLFIPSPCHNFGCVSSEILVDSHIRELRNRVISAASLSINDVDLHNLLKEGLCISIRKSFLQNEKWTNSVASSFN